MGCPGIRDVPRRRRWRSFGQKPRFLPKAALPAPRLGFEHCPRGLIITPDVRSTRAGGVGPPPFSLYQDLLARRAGVLRRVPANRRRDRPLDIHERRRAVAGGRRAQAAPRISEEVIWMDVVERIK